MPIPTPTLADPVFRIRTRETILHGSLFNVMAACADGSLLDLPGMRAHQRAPVVTTLAILMAVLQQYSGHSPTNAHDWRDEWTRQVGLEALRLVAPIKEPAFMQAPVDALGGSMDLSEVDCTFMSQAHAAKPLATGDAEAWALTLMSSIWRPYGGVGHHAAARPRPVAVLVGDGTLASEVSHLMRAYLDGSSREVGVDTSPTRAGDHLLWLQPWRTRLQVGQCPYPFLDARSVRLVEDGDTIQAKLAKTPGPMVQVDGHLDDPHVPLSNGRPLALAGSRGLDRDRQHGIIAGTDKVSRAQILERAQGYRVVRLCGIQKRGSGPSVGYHETVFSIRAPERWRLGGSGDQLSNLSSRMLTALSSCQGKVLWRALIELYGDKQDPHVSRGMAHYDEQTATASLQVIIDLAQADLDAEAEQKVIHQFVVSHAWEVFLRARDTHQVILDAAHAENLFRGSAYRALGEAKLPTDDTPGLARRAYAVIREIAKHLTPDEKAHLRSSVLSTPSVIYWSILAAVPREQAEDTSAEAVWRTVIYAMGRISVGSKPSIGQVLSSTDMPEMRVSGLLSATGDTLTHLVGETFRWLVSHEVERAALDQLATLGLADAVGDTAAREWARRRIALDWARADHRQARGNAA